MTVALGCTEAVPSLVSCLQQRVECRDESVVPSAVSGFVSGLETF